MKSIKELYADAYDYVVDEWENIQPWLYAIGIVLVLVFVALVLF